jgi:tetratricopeptide (TPR) repeat protein
MAVSQYELYRALADLVPDAIAELASHDPARQGAVLETALRALQGNRSDHPTTVGADGQLVYLPRHVPREISVRTLGLIKTAAPEHVLQLLNEIVAAYPDSSLPITYRGELQLWLGDYDAARRDLEAALAQRETTRWAYYGLALLANVEGEPRRALDICARSVVVIGSEGPPIFAHRGEALRRLGQSAAAVAELRRANELSPGRLSGHLNLALAAGDSGDAAAEAAGYEWLRQQAPTLVSDAAHGLGIVGALDLAPLPRATQRAVLEQMLVMMRGNRASSFTTWISPAGLVRVAGAVQGGTGALQRFRDEAPHRWASARRLIEPLARISAPAPR